MHDEMKLETLDTLEECAYTMAAKISQQAKEQGMCLDDDDIQRMDYLTHTLKSIASVRMAEEYDDESYEGYSNRRARRSMDGYSGRRGRSRVTGRYISREGGVGGGGVGMENNGQSGRRNYAMGKEENEQTIAQIEKLLNQMK